MKNESFSLEIEQFFGYFINELTLTFENFKKIDIMNFLEYKNQVLQNYLLKGFELL